MADPLVVYVAGWEAASVAAAIQRDARVGALLEPLALHGVAVQPWMKVRLIVPSNIPGGAAVAASRGSISLADDELWRSDVLLLRASDLAAAVCDTCDRLAFEEETAAAHSQSTGHSVRRASAAPMRWLLQAVEVNRSLLRNRAFVFDLDETVPSLESGGVLAASSVRRAIRLADLTLVTSKEAAEAIRDEASAVRVVEYGADLAWAVRHEPHVGKDPVRGLRLLAVGPTDAVSGIVEACARTRVEMPVLWIAADRVSGERILRVDPPIALDEAPRRLAALGADVAIVAGRIDPASAALWWLQFSLAGLPVVAARPDRADSLPIRDGVDGLLATPEEWPAVLDGLAESPSLRRSLVAAARRRIREEYSLAASAKALAEALRWAAEHAGVAAASRLVSAGGISRDEVLRSARAEASATLAHNRTCRSRAIEDRLTLERLRDGRDVCWADEDAEEPLVTIQIATYDRGQVAVDRAVKSALAQTYSNIEILVVGDAAPREAARAFKAVDDPRFRFVNLRKRGSYPAEPEHRWLVAGAAPMNHILRIARGAWIAPLDDDDEFPPDHVETLLGLAIENRLEFIYGQAECEGADGRWTIIGEWPPRQGGITHGSVLYSSRLRFLEYDPEAWRNEEPGDWCLWRRMLEAGVRMGFVEQIVFRHYAEGRHRRPSTHARDIVAARAGESRSGEPRRLESADASRVFLEAIQ